MAAGINSTFILENNGYSVEVTLTETYEILPNVSAVSVGLRVKSAYVADVEYLSGSIKLDGENLVVMNSTISTHHVQISSLNTWYRVVKSSSAYTDPPWTREGVTHNTDGSKEISLELELRGYGTDNYLSFRVAASKTIQLTHIPRASTVGASDANVGAVSTLSVIRRSADYTHSIAYQFGALSGYLNADGSLSAAEVKLTETSIPFLLPESFYSQIPNSPTGECVLTVKTYSGNAQIGDAQTATFTVTAAKRLCTPELSGRVEDTNADTIVLTGDKNILVRYASNALCTITAVAKNGAAIVSKVIAGEEVQEDSRSLGGVETGAVAFSCMDSRGYTASAVVEKNLIPYIHLTASLSASRYDPTSGNAFLAVAGNCYQGSFGAEENAVTVQYSINGGNPVAVETVLDGNSFSAEADLTGLDYQRSHTIAVTVTDKLESITKSVSIGKGIPVFDWDNDDFQFHVPVSLGDNLLMDLADPVQDTDAVNLSYARGAFAPAGFGLGVNAVEIDNLDNAVAFGLTVSNTGAPDAERWTCLTVPYSSRYATQIAWRAEVSEKTVLEARRQKYGGSWGDWITDDGYRRVLLWENDNRTEAYAPTTLALDLSGYDEVMIYFCLNHGQYNKYLVSGQCPVGEVLLGQFTWADDGITYHRSCETSEQEIKFNEGFYYGTIDNRSCIPYRIYGIKGIKSNI